MYGREEVSEMLRLVFQVYDFLVEIQLFLQENDPYTLCEGAPA